MIKAFIDGSCQPINPGGIATYGVLIWLDGERRSYTGYRLPISGPTSNNIAEYAAALRALQVLADQREEEITIHGDSRLVIEQMKGNWQIKGGKYRPLALRCRVAARRFPHLLWLWIPREQNTEADGLAHGVYQRVRTHA